MMAWFVGICIHLLHFCLRMQRFQIAEECSCSWEDFPADDVDGAWVNWVSHITRRPTA